MSEGVALDELLMAHAAGRLAEPVALLIATHLSLSPAGRRRYACYEALGGELLAQLQPDSLDDDALDQVLDRLTDEVDEPIPPSRHDRRWPAPLCDYLPDDLNQLHWRGYGSAIDTELPIDALGYRTRLIRVRAGRAVPRHTHDGQELTLVLEGAYRDFTGRYSRGDIEIGDPTLDHRPVAENASDCLCLAVTDAPLRLTGRFGRLLNRFVRI